MRDSLRWVVDVLTSFSVVVSVITYYLSINKTWIVKHERSVAASVSISSYAIYSVVLVLNLLNMLLNAAPWQTVAEYVFAIGNTIFIVLVGLGWWVNGAREKGLWRLLVESLRSEREHAFALAAAFVRPAASRSIVSILTQVAMIDGKLEDKEKGFIENFARAWGITVDWETVVNDEGDDAARYARLRKTINAYLAVSPPTDQALQLADVIRRLVEVDGHVSDREDMIATELGGLLERYGGRDDHAMTYEVRLVPQSPEQAAMISARFPELERRATPGGSVFICGSYFSLAYAELVRAEFGPFGVYTAIEHKSQTSTSASPPAAPHGERPSMLARALSATPEPRRPKHPSEPPAA